MRVVIRFHKKQVRVVAAVSLLVALGAAGGFAAQASGPRDAAPASNAEPAPKAAAEPAGLSPASVWSSPVLPHDDSIVAARHPEERLQRGAASPAALPIENEAEQGPQSQGQQGTGQQGGPQGQQDPQQAQAQPPPQAGAPAQGLEDFTPAELEALALIEQIIRDQEGVLMGSGFDYVAAGRRDPFRSLLEQVSSLTAPSSRPFGLAGFMIGEVDLKAVALAQGRWHAMVVAPNQRAYFLEVGTELYDGHVTDIRPGEVVFEQQVPDLMGARRTREVTKRLRTNDGGGS